PPQTQKRPAFGHRAFLDLVAGTGLGTVRRGIDPLDQFLILLTLQVMSLTSSPLQTPGRAASLTLARAYQVYEQRFKRKNARRFSTGRFWIWLRGQDLNL